MNNLLNPKHSVIAPHGMSTNESGALGKVVGQSSRKHFTSKVKNRFILLLSSCGIIMLVAIDTKLLAGTMGEKIWNEFGEGGLAVFVPLAMVMIAAFAHRLISTQSDEELKRSWVGRLVKKLSVALVFSIAILFSATMFKSLYPPASDIANTSSGWGLPSETTRGYVESLAAGLAAILSPFAEGAFALISGAILIITAFLLLMMMDWWYCALKALIVDHSRHKALLNKYEEVKHLRTRYIPVAATINSEAVKTEKDREMEFAVYFVNQGLKTLSEQRAGLSDRKLKERIKNPTWPEIGEKTLSGDPAEIFKQRKEFEQSLNIEKILTIIRRTSQ